MALLNVGRICRLVRVCLGRSPVGLSVRVGIPLVCFAVRAGIDGVTRVGVVVLRGVRRGVWRGAVLRGLIFGLRVELVVGLAG